MRCIVMTVMGVLGLAASGNAATARQRATVLVGEIRRADYAGDRAALRRLRADLEPLASDRTIASRVRYWQGFALWRRAFNGFNDSTPSKELAEDLTAATADFDAALALDPTLADAQIGAISCMSNLIFLDRQDSQKVQDWLKRVGPRVEDVKNKDPDNPRFAWVMGANRWYAPPERGGGQEPAMAIYAKGLAEARRRKVHPSGPLEPSWGEPELLMNLAWSNLNKTAPDFDAAERDARAALAILPEWHYVRDILLVQIRNARTKGTGTAGEIPSAAKGPPPEDFGFDPFLDRDRPGPRVARIPKAFESPGQMTALDSREEHEGS
jgi:hypothetical protein